MLFSGNLWHFLDNWLGKAAPLETRMKNKDLKLNLKVLFIADFCRQVRRHTPACGGDCPDQQRSDPQAGGGPGGAGQETGPAGQQSDQVERQAWVTQPNGPQQQSNKSTNVPLCWQQVRDTADGIRCWLEAATTDTSAVGAFSLGENYSHYGVLFLISCQGLLCVFLLITKEPRATVENFVKYGGQ